MNVRGWLMIGQHPPAAGLLLAVEPTHAVWGPLPEANEYQPGAFLIWHPAPGAAPVCIVCVEVPLK